MQLHRHRPPSTAALAASALHMVLMLPAAYKLNNHTKRVMHGKRFRCALLFDAQRNYGTARREDTSTNYTHTLHSATEARARSVVSDKFDKKTRAGKKIPNGWNTNRKKNLCLNVKKASIMNECASIFSTFLLGRVSLLELLIFYAICVQETH